MYQFVHLLVCVFQVSGCTSLFILLSVCFRYQGVPVRSSYCLCVSGIRDVPVCSFHCLSVSGIRDVPVCSFYCLCVSGIRCTSLFILLSVCFRYQVYQFVHFIV